MLKNPSKTKEGFCVVKLKNKYAKAPIAIGFKSNLKYCVI
jgi:hypothetical protein